MNIPMLEIRHEPGEWDAFEGKAPGKLVMTWNGHWIGQKTIPPLYEHDGYSDHDVVDEAVAEWLHELWFTSPSLLSD